MIATLHHRRRMTMVLAICLAPAFAMAEPPADPAKPEATAPEATAPSAGQSLMEQGARIFMRGLMDEMGPALDDMGKAVDELRPKLQEIGPQLRELIALMGDMRNYAMPERLPNGDILIRRQAPLAPNDRPDAAPQSEPPQRLPLPPGRPQPGPNGEIEL